MQQGFLSASRNDPEGIVQTLILGVYFAGAWFRMRFWLSEAFSSTRLYTRFFSAEEALRMNSENGEEVRTFGLRLSGNMI